MAKQLTLILGLIAALMITSGADAADRLKLSSTTSTDNTGLLAYLLPKFTAKTGLRVDVIAVGTGKALTLAENGDVDVTLVHAPSRERAFVEAGHGVNHRMVMANYFIIVGPEADPAQAGKAEAAEAAFERIAKSQAPFISRGDESGTHTKEQAIWKDASRRAAHGPKLVSGIGERHGRDAHHRRRKARLHPVRFGHLPQIRRQGRPENPVPPAV